MIHQTSLLVVVLQHFNRITKKKKEIYVIQSATTLVGTNDDQNPQETVSFCELLVLVKTAIHQTMHHYMQTIVRLQNEMNETFVRNIL